MRPLFCLPWIERSRPSTSSPSSGCGPFHSPAGRPMRPPGYWLLVAALGLGLNLATWQGLGAALDYNHTLRDLVWQVVLHCVDRGPGRRSAAHQADRGLHCRAGFPGLAFLGHAAHLLVHEAGSYSGVIRLAYIAAFPSASDACRHGELPRPPVRPASERARAHLPAQGAMEQMGKRRRHCWALRRRPVARKSTRRLRVPLRTRCWPICALWLP